MMKTIVHTDRSKERRNNSGKSDDNSMPKSKTPTKEECMLLNLSICSNTSEIDNPKKSNKSALESTQQHPEICFKDFRPRRPSSQDRSYVKYGSNSNKSVVATARVGLSGSKPSQKDLVSVQRKKRHEIYKIISDANKSHWKHVKRDDVRSSADDTSEKMKRSISITLPNKLNRYSASTKILQTNPTHPKSQNDFRVRSLVNTHDNVSLNSKSSDCNASRKFLPSRETVINTKSCSDYNQKRACSVQQGQGKQQLIDLNVNRILKNRSDEDSVRLIDFIKQSRNGTNYSEQQRSRRARHKEYIISQIAQNSERKFCVVTDTKPRISKKQTPVAHERYKKNAGIRNDSKQALKSVVSTLHPPCQYSRDVAKDAPSPRVIALSDSEDISINRKTSTDKPAPTKTLLSNQPALQRPVTEISQSKGKKPKKKSRKRFYTLCSDNRNRKQSQECDSDDLTPDITTIKDPLDDSLVINKESLKKKLNLDDLRSLETDDETNLDRMLDEITSFIEEKVKKRSRNKTMSSLRYGPNTVHLYDPTEVNNDFFMEQQLSTAPLKGILKKKY